MFFDYSEPILCLESLLTFPAWDPVVEPLVGPVVNVVDLTGASSDSQQIQGSLE